MITCTILKEKKNRIKQAYFFKFKTPDFMAKKWFFNLYMHVDNHDRVCCRSTINLNKFNAPIKTGSIELNS